MTQQGFSALLKTIEEPSPFSSFFLITSKIEMIPRTIISRCIGVRFSTRNLQKIISEKIKQKFQTKELLDKLAIISFLNPNIPDIIQDAEELQKIWEMIESVIVGEGEYRIKFIKILDEFVQNDRDKAKKFLASLESFVGRNPEKFGKRAISIWENIKKAHMLVELFVPPKFALLTFFDS
jgi:DNA polymerase III delta prime subunit